MTNVSGRFTGKCTSQTICSLSDTPQHELALMEISGPQRTNDENWQNTNVHYWATSDLISGKGVQRGYFVNEHPNGECDCGTFECQVTTSQSGQCTIEGTWRYTHGTGRFSGIQGNGTCKGQLMSPTEVEMSWDGSYQLAAGSRAA